MNLNSILTLLIAFFTLSLTIPSGGGENIIYWEEGYDLQFADFKAVPPSGKGSCNSHCTIGVDNKFDKDRNEQVVIMVTVHNIFTRTKSWITGKDQKLLNHERGHFDLSEVYARKMRQKIDQQTLTYGNYRGIIQQLHQQTLNELRQRRNKYAAETSVGTDETQQLLWQKVIEKELKSLSNYKNPVITKRIGS